LKLDEQLRDKVDRYNFDEYGKKMDSKINNEIGKKLDKSDLKKNNNIMYKKIDHLENKISKTLVDTLIDLQIDDMPLLVKKGAGGNEKCASCNQCIPQNHCSNNGCGNSNQQQQNAYYQSTSPIVTTLSRYNDMSERYKLKNIHELSNKLGVGSYSRILNNVQVDTLLDDLAVNNTITPNPASFHKNRKGVGQSGSMTNISTNLVNLPDINKNDKTGKVSNNNSVIYTGTTSTKHVSMSPDIQSHLEKKIVKGEHILKSVDKLYSEKHIEKK
jgi:hypothetical protein